MNTLTPEHRDKVRELLGLWLADPDRDLEDALLWCERWVATKPYTLTVNDNLPWIVAGAYRIEHPAQMSRWTRALTGYHETRRTPWR